MTEYKIKTSDNQEVHVYEWIPEDEQSVKAVLQIAHGMAEHGARYEDFAQFLNKNGYAVFANDHKGHGKTAGTLEITSIPTNMDNAIINIASLNSKKNFNTSISVYLCFFDY